MSCWWSRSGGAWIPPDGDPQFLHADCAATAAVPGPRFVLDSERDASRHADPDHCPPQPSRHAGPDHCPPLDAERVQPLAVAFSIRAFRLGDVLRLSLPQNISRGMCAPLVKKPSPRLSHGSNFVVSTSFCLQTGKSYQDQTGRIPLSRVPSPICCWGLMYHSPSQLSAAFCWIVVRLAEPPVTTGS